MTLVSRLQAEVLVVEVGVNVSSAKRFVFMVTCNELTSVRFGSVRFGSVRFGSVRFAIQSTINSSEI